ncbi:GGDEF domain-containing protein [uncultured Acetobacterium sp.]|uniref:GGDEF domain-containing protein n=1 Tax=uncultured Acetobacterium sp. TaxID=217139 RepID=UPI0025ED75DB|nr:GGDEF domain-containing protein [uncultured Acetobacterium sp.]
MVYKLVFTQHKAETLSQITKIDALTQLKNREGLYDDAQNEIANETPFSLIFLDLDDFKSINDLYGHAAGDAYLIAFARSVSEYLKPNEGLYRLHGDEFVILSKSLEIEPFCRQLEKFNCATNLEGLDFKGLSFGYATFPTDARKLSDLLHLADLKMYETKNRKRNRTSS